MLIILSLILLALLYIAWSIVRLNNNFVKAAYDTSVDLTEVVLLLRGTKSIEEDTRNVLRAHMPIAARAVDSK